MFDLPRSRIIETDLPLIWANYQVLHFDEIPILFTGTNKFGNRIMGSSIDEDYASGTARFFHIMLDPSNYTAFIKRRKSYRTLLQEAKPIFVIDRSIEDDHTTPRIYLMTFEELQNNYKPLDESYCPQRLLIPSDSYSVHLGGRLADTGRIETRAAGETQTLLDQLVRCAFHIFEDILSIQPQLLFAPSSSGSFTINFELKIREIQGNIFKREIDYFSYLNSYLSYCLHNLPHDIPFLIVNDYNHLVKFQELLSSYLDLLVDVNEQVKIESSQELTGNIYQATKLLGALSSHIGMNYDSMIIVNQSDEGEDPLGVINGEYKSQIETVIPLIEETTQKPVVAGEVDALPQIYHIQIYDLNTNTRTGFAQVQASQGTRIYRPKITISGRDPEQPLARSKYTKSLHLDEFIDVQGIATRTGERITTIEILYEASSDDIYT